MGVFLTQTHKTIVICNIKHNYLSRNLVFVLYISTASHSLLQQTEVTDVSHDQCHVTQAGVGPVGAPVQHLGST